MLFRFTDLIFLFFKTVCYARGKSKHNNGKNWKTSDDRQATIDDISVFVIPLKPYRDEYKEWKRTRNIINIEPSNGDTLKDDSVKEWFK